MFHIEVGSSIHDIDTRGVAVGIFHLGLEFLDLCCDLLDHPSLEDEHLLAGKDQKRRNGVQVYNILIQK